MKTMTQREYIDEGISRFGTNLMDWRFVCPRCGHIQSVRDFVDAGMEPKDAVEAAPVSCIGRVDSVEVGCDWALYGLLKIHRLEVEIPSESEPPEVRPSFEFAPGPPQPARRRDRQRTAPESSQDPGAGEGGSG